MALILVTGASTGLGLATAMALAAGGHDVVLHARNARRVRDPALLDQMHDVIHGDLSRLDETKLVAKRANAIGRFDAVIHNAGVFRGPDVLAVNAVAPFVLTAVMTRPARSIYLSSSMHLSGSPYFTKAGLTSGSSATYEDSKLYVTALALALAKRWPGVMAHAVDPGWVPTRMGGPSATDSLGEGHRTQEWLATAAETEISPRSGGYWYHGRVRQPHPAASDPQFQEQLIRALEEHTGMTLPA
jgi:NAD(P)-dependent dehydrogenase (short-subunit alcohol dehydrogenase family)